MLIPDILRVHIFPLLDMESRINLNRVVPPSDRYSLKIKKATLLSHEHTTMIRDYNQYREDSYSYIWNDSFKQRIMTRMYRSLLNPRVMRAYRAMINHDIYIDHGMCSDKIFRCAYPSAYTEALKAQELYTQLNSQ